MNTTQHQDIWSKAPANAWAWERYPNQKCVWHCRHNGESSVKKAPNLDTERKTLYRDLSKQLEAYKINSDLNDRLLELNIVLAH